MKWTTDNIGNLDNKIIIVTGANSGLGYHTSLELARKGANVIMACRNMDKAKKARLNIQHHVKDAKLDIRHLDLSDLDSVRKFSDEFKKDYSRLDILVNNAGLMAIPRLLTKQGFEMQFGINHLGHFALTLLLADIITRTENSRVVTVSSLAHLIGKIKFSDLNHEKTYNKWQAYGQSKLSNLLFTSELQRRLENAGISTISVAAHPGWAGTNFQTRGPEMEGSNLKKWMYKMGNKLFSQSAAMGTLPILFAATDSSVKGGQFIGPDKMFGFKGYPRQAKLNGNKVNEETARKLWEVSEQLSSLQLKLD